MTQVNGNDLFDLEATAAESPQFSPTLLCFPNQNFNLHCPD